MGVPTKVPIARMDYLLDTDITVTADPRMASQPQRFQEATTILNAVNSTPAAASMPLLQIAALRLLFKAIDNTEMTAALAQTLSIPPSRSVSGAVARCPNRREAACLSG